jgi:hypothetical protein
VIDGQQRLTALFLLLSALGEKPAIESLSYEHRIQSAETLKILQKGELSNESEELDNGMYEAFEMIKLKLWQLENPEIERQKTTKDEFKERLKKVVIFRIEVPPHTDLNKYFEIRNNRGEQLEQHDILKARLMEVLGEDEKAAFARVWDACSNMDGYVQMNFTNKKERKHYFGNRWDKWPEQRLFPEDNKKKNGNEGPQPISEIIKGPKPPIGNTIEDDDGINKRFESFIAFPHLLLHTLKVYNGKENTISLDDKKLLEHFKEPLEEKKKFTEKFAKDFIICLLRCRFLLDNFMLKREFIANKDHDDGEWSLKKLNVSSTDRGKTAYFVQSSKDGNAELDKETLMLQSMLRVTYTSPHSMHWVTDYLKYLYGLYENEQEQKTYDKEKANQELRGYARKAVKKYVAGEEKPYNNGTATPHIVFNYLDFLIWKNPKDFLKELDVSKFKFEFRNSVEHWYPQKPREDGQIWGEPDLHHFGNLCIVSRKTNSRFSNDLPLGKKEKKKKTISQQSLKLQIMKEQTTDNQEWKKTAREHGEKMIKLLEE